MRAVCRECGLCFECGDALNAWRAGPPWHFEYGDRASIRRLIGTLLRLPWAMAFWQGVKMELPIRGGRLMAVVALVLMLLHLSVAAPGVAIAANEIRLHLSFLNWPATTTPDWTEVVQEAWPALVRAAVWPYSIPISDPMRPWISGLPWTARPRLGGPALGGVAVFAATVPLAFFALGETLRRCRVRRLHLLRGFAWSLPVPAGVMIATTGALLIHPVQNVAWLGAGLAILWLSNYWQAFARRYLQLPHAWGVLASMLVIGLLTAAIVQLWVGSLVWHLV